MQGRDAERERAKTENIHIHYGMCRNGGDGGGGGGGKKQIFVATLRLVPRTANPLYIVRNRYANRNDAAAASTSKTIYTHTHTIYAHTHITHIIYIRSIQGALLR